jgi:hypothetical protein
VGVCEGVGGRVARCCCVVVVVHVVDYTPSTSPIRVVATKRATRKGIIILIFFWRREN